MEPATKRIKSEDNTHSRPQYMVAMLVLTNELSRGAAELQCWLLPPQQQPTEAFPTKHKAMLTALYHPQQHALESLDLYQLLTDDDDAKTEWESGPGNTQLRVWSADEKAKILADRSSIEHFFIQSGGKLLKSHPQLSPDIEFTTRVCFNFE